MAINHGMELNKELINQSECFSLLRIPFSSDIKIISQVVGDVHEAIVYCSRKCEIFPIEYAKGLTEIIHFKMWTTSTEEE